MSQKKNNGLDRSYAKEQFKTTPLKKDQGFKDPYFIEGKDPSRAYKHINFNNFRKNGFRDIRGWVPLTKQTATTEVIPDSMDWGVPNQDGFLHVGDTIAAWMPIERYTEMRRQQADINRAKVSSVSNEAKRIAKQGGLVLTEEK